jgi:hypothetical protein
MRLAVDEPDIGLAFGQQNVGHAVLHDTARLMAHEGK